MGARLSAAPPRPSRWMTTKKKFAEQFKCTYTQKRSHTGAGEAPPWDDRGGELLARILRPSMLSTGEQAYSPACARHPHMAFR